MLERIEFVSTNMEDASAVKHLRALPAALIPLTLTAAGGAGKPIRNLR